MDRAFGIPRALALADERSGAHGEPLEGGVDQIVHREGGVRYGERHVAHAPGEEHEDREGEDVEDGIDARGRTEAKYLQVKGER